MELYSDKIIITLNATYGNEIYNIQGKSPQHNLLNWDEVIKILYIFDGIQFDENQPYYNIKNEYINIHIRYVCEKGERTLAYASDNHRNFFSRLFL